MDFNLIVLAYNRLASLKRLLQSIEQASIPNGTSLYFSLEFDSHPNVIEFIDSYTWKYGRKIIIQQDTRLGVHGHNLECLKLIEDIGNGLVLEDDIVVSPFFMKYLEKVLPVYLEDNSILGVSIYRYLRVETIDMPFMLIPNNEFLYYQNRPSCNGCFYVSERIKLFNLFINKTELSYSKYILPPNAVLWENDSWEKMMYCFLQEYRMTQIFPRYSFSTDFGEFGVHMKKRIDKFKHHSIMYLDKEFPEFVDRKFSKNVYDAHYELNPDVVKQHNARLESYDFEMDIYGTKQLLGVDSNLLLSSKKSKSPLVQFGRFYKPEINNILLGVSGNFYSLSTKDAINFSTDIKKTTADFFYHYSDIKLTTLVKLKVKEVIERYTSNN